MSQGSVAASSDNDWGSDFEDATEAAKDASETANNMKVFFENIFSLIPPNCPQTPEVLKATADTSKVWENVRNTKVYSKPKISSSLTSLQVQHLNQKKLNIFNPALNIQMLKKQA